MYLRQAPGGGSCTQQVTDLVMLLALPAAANQLVARSGSKAVVKAKKGDAAVSGQYFPIPACQVREIVPSSCGNRQHIHTQCSPAPLTCVPPQKFDKDPAIFTNGVFLGALAYMIFAGPYEVKKVRGPICCSNGFPGSWLGLQPASCPGAFTACLACNTHHAVQAQLQVLAVAAGCALRSLIITCCGGCRTLSSFVSMVIM